MAGKILRKVLIYLIIAAPLLSFADCKKQARCGCGKDVLNTITQESASVYWTTDGQTIYLQRLSDPFSYYYFCNPSEMFGNLKDAKQGDILVVSGNVYWNCNYVSQSSSYPYSSYQRVYDIHVTELVQNLFGKKSETSPVR